MRNRSRDLPVVRSVALLLGACGGASGDANRAVPIETQNASAAVHRLPSGMHSLPAGGSGTVLTTTLASGSVTSVTQALVRDLQPYFGGTMRVLKAIEDRSGAQVQASFSAQLGGVPVIGLLAVAEEGTWAHAVVIFDESRALAESLNRLMRVARADGEGASTASPEALTRTTVPDGSVNIDLAPGWVIRRADKGAMDIQGQAPGSGMSLGAVSTVPFTSADPAEALVIMAQQAGRAQL